MDNADRTLHFFRRIFVFVVYANQDGSIGDRGNVIVSFNDRA